MGPQTAFAVCFSGHRPEKLPQDAERRMLKSLLYEEIRTAIRDGADTFYSGMAQGVDLWAAEAVLLLRKEYPVRLIAVRPYATHGNELKGSARYRYNMVLNGADETIVLAERYHRGCYAQRNSYMVSHSRRLIAVVFNMRSGTGQTIRMAERMGLEVRRLSLPTFPPLTDF